jgi:hypothetical protein
MGLTLVELISLAGLVLAVIGLIMKMNKDRIGQEAWLTKLQELIISNKTNSDLQFKNIEEKILTAQVNRATELATCQKQEALNLRNIAKDVESNHALVTENTRQNREDHTALFAKLDSLKDLIIERTTVAPH